MNNHTSEASIQALQKAALDNKNVFEALMEITKTCTLGQVTNALFDVGGEYRRSM